MSSWLLGPKASYFFICALVNALAAYQAQLYADLWDVPIWKYGFMSSLQAFRLFGALFWSNLADRYGKRHTHLVKWIITLSITVYVLLSCAMWAPRFAPTVMAVVFGQDGRHLPLYFMFLNGAGQFFIAGAFPLLDATVLRIVEAEVGDIVDPESDLIKVDSTSNFVEVSDNREVMKSALFGRQRVYGCFGYALATVLASFAMVRVGYSGIYALLAGYAVALIGCVHIGLSIPPASGSSSPSQSSASNTSWLGPLRALWRTPEFVHFEVFLFLAGLGRAVLHLYGFYYLERVLHFTKPILSATSIARLLGELSLYWGSKWVVQRLGLRRMFLLSQIMMLTRLIGYALLPPLDGSNDNFVIYAVYAMECLSGMTSSLCVISAVRLSSELAPSGSANAAQGVFAGSFTGLGEAVCGCAMSGLLYLYGTSIIGTGNWDQCLRPSFITMFIAVFGVEIGMVWSFLRPVAPRITVLE